MQVRSGTPRKRPKVLDSLRQDPPRARWGRDRFSPAWARPARRAPRFVHDTLAVTPVIGTVMILAISVIGIATVLTWGLPNIQQTQASTEVDGVTEAFLAFDQIAEQVVRGGAVGKASEAKLTIPSGSIERKDGSLLVLAWSPHHADHVNTDRFYFEGLDDDVPEIFTVRSLSGTGTMSVTAARSMLTDLTDVTTDSITTNFVGSDTVTVSLEDPIHKKPTRIQVFREVNSDLKLVLEAWILPLGVLQYTRESNVGTQSVLLENSAVITETGPSRFMKSYPLATVERDGGAPRFVALFPMLLAEHAELPAVQGAGSGTYPLLWALAGNTLRANGAEAVSLQLKVVGDRGPVWMQHFSEDRYGFVPNMPDDPSIRLDAAPGNPFNLVVMQSTIEVTMKHETAAMGSSG